MLYKTIAIGRFEDDRFEAWFQPWVIDRLKNEAIEVLEFEVNTEEMKRIMEWSHINLNENLWNMFETYKQLGV
jgi:hypothetical protein